MDALSLQQSQTAAAGGATELADNSTETVSEVELLRAYLLPGSSSTWHEAADLQSPAEVLQLMGRMSFLPTNAECSVRATAAPTCARHVNACWCSTVPLQCSRLSTAMARSDLPASPADVASSLARLAVDVLEHMSLSPSPSAHDRACTMEKTARYSALKAVTHTFHRYMPQVRACVLHTTMYCAILDTGSQGYCCLRPSPIAAHHASRLCSSKV